MFYVSINLDSLILEHLSTYDSSYCKFGFICKILLSFVNAQPYRFFKNKRYKNLRQYKILRPSYNSTHYLANSITANKYYRVYFMKFCKSCSVPVYSVTEFYSQYLRISNLFQLNSVQQLFQKTFCHPLAYQTHKIRKTRTVTNLCLTQLHNNI